MTSPRRSLLTRAGGLMLAAAVGVSVGHGTQRVQAGTILSPAAAAPATATLRIATLNTQAGLTTRQALSDITRLAGTGADVVALQEMGSPARRAAVRAALADCSMCPYEAYFPVGAPANSTPILFRWSKFRLEGTGSKQVSEATYVGAAGAGPSTLRAKYINWVKLRERATGQTVYILNNHAVPSVQAKDGGANHRHPERLELYRQHMEGLKTMITGLEATGAAVFVTGDLNVNYRRDRIVRDPLFPFQNMRQVNTRASYQALGEPARGTHVLPNGFDKRLIDYVYFLDHAAVSADSQRIPLRYNSDHRPLIVDFTLRSAS